MSTIQIRNIVKSQVDNQLIRAKARIQQEGKRKLNELKDQLPTPEDISQQLLVDINQDSCSDKGRAKFLKKYNKIYRSVDQIHNVTKNVLEKIENIDEIVRPMAEGTEGPFKTLNTIKDTLNNSIMPILQIIVLAAPAALGPLVGLANSAAAADAIATKRDKAIAKTKEYVALLACIPIMISFYQKQAQKILTPIDLLMNKLTFLKEEIDKIKAFLYSLKLQYLQNCADLANAQNNSSEGTTLPDPTGSTPLSDYLALLKEQYNDVYNQLQQANNEKYVERVYALKENLEEDFNISFEVKNFLN